MEMRISFLNRPSLILASWLLASLSWCTKSTSASTNLDMNILDDGPTSDQSPGIGVEFESDSLTLHSATWEKSNTPRSKVKGQILGGRKGDHWALTVDTTPKSAGTVDAEYILDGTKIKIGAGTAVKAAEQVAADLV